MVLFITADLPGSYKKETIASISAEVVSSFSGIIKVLESGSYGSRPRSNPGIVRSLSYKLEIDHRPIAEDDRGNRHKTGNGPG